MPGYEMIGNEEFQEIKDIFDKGGVLFRHSFDNLRNNSFKVRQFEEEFARKMSSKKALAVSSGTAALRVALAALGIGEGDEVITQSFTFVATVEAIIESRAKPVCTNIDSTLNMDPADLEKLITPKTKAVIAVHMLGVPARLKEIKSLCDKHNIFLIEDTAWGCGGNLEGKPLGTWGDIGTFSFDFVKTITTGEGGMLVFNNEKIYEKAAAWHDHGHENNPNLPRWKDSRSSSGFNYRMTELQGAVGIAQLKKLDSIVSKQRENSNLILEKISDIEEITIRCKPENSYETADALIFLMRDSLTANNCREQLLKNGLSTKILPEAYTWHFAGSWEHMGKDLSMDIGEYKDYLKPSSDLLSRSVSIAIGVSLNSENPSKIRNSILETIKI